LRILYGTVPIEDNLSAVRENDTQDSGSI